MRLIRCVCLACVFIGSLPITVAKGQPRPAQVPVPEAPGVVPAQGAAPMLRVMPAQPVQFGAVVRNEFAFVDQILFSNGNSLDGMRSQLNTQLELQVEECVKSEGLGPDQKQKLMLAGRGDIERHMEKIQALREHHSNRQMQQFDPQAIAELHQQASALRIRHSRSIFGDRSLFAKTRYRMLPEDGRQRLQEQAAKLKARAIRNHALNALARFEGFVPLTAKQREELQPIFQRLAEATRHDDPKAIYRILIAFLELKPEEIDSQLSQKLRPEDMQPARNFGAALKQALDAKPVPVQVMGGGMF